MKNIKYELLSKYRNVNNFDGKSPLYIVTEDTNEKVSHSILTEESLNHLLEHGKPKPYDSNDFVYFLIKKDGLDPRDSESVLFNSATHFQRELKIKVYFF